MADWKSHLNAGAGFLAVPALGAVALGAGGYLIEAPSQLYGYARTMTQGGESVANNARILWAMMLGGGGLWFSVWPDVDVTSMGRKLTWMGIGSLYAVAAIAGRAEGTLFWAWAIPNVLLSIAGMWARHRGWTHRIETTVLAPALMIGVPGWLWAGEEAGLMLWAAGSIGHLSHLFMDGILVDRTRKARKWMRRL